MPTYNYRCDRCEHEFEAFQKITEDPLKKCPECAKHALQRVPSAVGISFKGAGFYINDYSKSGSTAKSESTASTSGGCCPCGKNTKCS